MFNFIYRGTKMKGIVEAIKLAVYAVFAYLDIPAEVFLILIAFMCADSILGSVAAVRLGNKFDFKILLWGFCLKLCFLIIPLLVSLLARSLGQDYAIAVEIVIKVLTVSEAYSCFGNIYSAKNKVKVDKMDVVSMLLKSLRTLLRNIIKRALNKIETGNNCEK